MGSVSATGAIAFVVVGSLLLGVPNPGCGAQTTATLIAQAGPLWPVGKVREELRPNSIVQLVLEVGSATSHFGPRFEVARLKLSGGTVLRNDPGGPVPTRALTVHGVRAGAWYSPRSPPEGGLAIHAVLAADHSRLEELVICRTGACTTDPSEGRLSFSMAAGLTYRLRVRRSQIRAGAELWDHSLAAKVGVHSIRAFAVTVGIGSWFER
jgi:hypothetical protein